MNSGPSPGLRGLVYETLFGLIASCGLRLSEALTLNIGDVDLRRGLLTIRRTKFAKSRQVPLHPSTAKALGRYRWTRDVAGASRDDDAPFFIGTRGRLFGKPISVHQVDNVFAKLRNELGWINRGMHHAPRIHDLRHNSESRIIPSTASNDAVPPEETGWSEAANDSRNYQRPFRKSMTRSLGLNRGIGTFLVVVLARARSLSCMSACR